MTWQNYHCIFILNLTADIWNYLFHILFIFTMGCHYRQNSAIVTFVNGASNFVYGAFVFINGASVFINGASVFVNGASNFVYGAFVFINGASNFVYGAFVFINGAFVFVNGAFNFVNGAPIFLLFFLMVPPCPIVLTWCLYLISIWYLYFCLWCLCFHKCCL